MPHLLSPEAFICNRCWTRLFEPSRRKRIALQLESSFHSRSRLRSAPGSKSYSDPPAHAAPYPSYRPFRNRNGDDQPRSQGWRTLLQNKTLGEAASILVLRDTERKKGGRRHGGEQQQEEQPSTNVDAGSLLESLEGQKIDPEQSEVNSSIDGLKPVAQKHGDLRPPTIAQEQYDKALRRLGERFNQIQLARYITHASQEQDMPAEAEQERSPLTRQWRPPNGANGKRPVAHRGKKGLADNIIRSVWGFEVEEEINGQGTLDIRLDHNRMALALLDEKSSALRDLEEKRNIKIEVIEAKKLVRLTGPKYTSFEAMADVEAVLQEPYEQRLDLSTYSSVRRQDESLKGGVDKRMIQRVAALQSCTVEFKTGSIMLVKGPEKQATEKFQRLLLAQFDLPVRTKDVILSGVPPNKEFGFIVVAPHMDDSPSQTPIDPHGRFTLSFKIAGGDAGKPKQLPEPDGLPEALMLDAHNRLKDPATFGLSLPKEPMSEMINASDAPRWHARPSTEFTTYYTHLLHRSKPNVVVLPVYTKELVGQLKMSPRTSPTVGGLPYILQQLALDTDIPVKTPRSRVRISLIPSPFTYNVNALRGMPTITMNLLLHPRDRQVSIESVQATLGTRGAHAMLGHLGMDMSMARREYLSLNDPESDPSLQAFVTSIAASYATFSSTDIFVPLNLKLRIPSYTLIPGALRKLPELQELAEAKEDVEIEYFAVSAQHQSDLIFDYEGQELVYRRSKDVETGKVEENVLLQNLSDGRGTEQTPLRASETAERPIDSADQTTTTPLQDFLETSQDVLCRLNAGLGKVRRMDDVLRKTEREARKQEEQQRQEASWDEGEGRFEEKPKSIVDDEGYSSRDRRIKGGVKVVKDPEESISVQ